MSSLDIDASGDVTPGLDFHDAEQVRASVAACEMDKPWREPMRRAFVDLVRALPAGARVLELGSGPGYLAECVLDACPNVESSTLVDFSEHMLALSRERVARFEAARFVRANFKAADWWRPLSPPYDAVLAMQAVHELRHKRHAPALYAAVRTLLEPGGLLAVCDGTPRDTNERWQTALLMTADEHREAMAAVAFTRIELANQIHPMVLVTARAPERRGNR